MLSEKQPSNTQQRNGVATKDPHSPIIQDAVRPPLRIAMLLPNLEIGGSQEVIRTLARHFQDHGTVPVVGSLFGGGPLVNDLRQQGTQVEVLSLSRRPVRALPIFATDMVRIWRTLADFFTRHRINAIQTNNLGSQDFLVLALARWMRIPVVTFNFHNEQFLPSRDKRSLQNAAHRAAYQLARRWASDYVAVSIETKRSMVRQLALADRDISVISNGVELPRHDAPTDARQLRRDLGFDSDAKLCLTVGTLKLQKGHRFLIDAAVEVVRRHPEAHFLFAGDGELRSELETQAARTGIADHIHFLGSRRDVSWLLIACDVFVLPSLWEGLSIALLEAMAAGLPIVATDVSGTRQLIEDGITGRMVPAGVAEALTEALCDVMSDMDGSRRLTGNAAREFVRDHYSLERQADQYLELYHRLMP